MKAIDTSKIDLRLGSEFRYWLIRLKTNTGVASMNILCRWALCVSLAEDSPLRSIEQNLKEGETEEKGLEIRWETFAGSENEIYLSLLKTYCHQNKIEITELNLQKALREHVQRGLGYLRSDVKGPLDLMAIAFK